MDLGSTFRDIRIGLPPNKGLDLSVWKIACTPGHFMTD